MLLKNKIFVTILILIMYMSVNHLKIQAMENVVFTGKINFESSSYLSYDLQISDESAIAGLTIEIKYDSQQLKIIKGEVGEVLLPTINKLNTKKDDTVILTAISTDPIMKAGNILHLEFELVDSTKQYVEINCFISECINQKCEELSCVVNSEKIINPQYKASEPDCNEVVSENSGEQNENENAQEEQKTEAKDVDIADTGEKEEINEEEHEKAKEEEKNEADKKQEIVENKETYVKNSNKSQYAVIICCVAIVSVTLLIFIIWKVRRKK